MHLHKLCAVSMDLDLRSESVDTYFLASFANHNKAAIVVYTVDITTITCVVGGNRCQGNRDWFRHRLQVHLDEQFRNP